METKVTHLGPTGQPRIVVINGISAVGKSTIYKNAFERAQFKERFGFSVSHTTRKPRPGEVNGVDYWFIDDEEFNRMVEQGKFLEYTINHGKSYGTSFEAVDAVLKSNKNLMLDIDYKGAVSLKRANMPYETLYVLVKPPTWDEFLARLRRRGTESEEQIRIRENTARQEIQFFEANPGFYDIEMVNDNLASAVEHFCGILEGFIVK